MSDDRVRTELDRLLRYVEKAMSDADTRAEIRKGLREGSVRVDFMKDRSVEVRDTKDPTKPPLRFTAKQWADFLAGVKAGEFDGE